MAIRFTINGTMFEVDTATEAAELQSLLSREQRGHGRSSHRTTPVQTNGTHAPSPSQSNLYRDFVGRLNSNGLKVVMALANNYPGTLTTDELAEKSKVGSLSLPPVIKHIRNAAIKSGLSLDDVITRRQVMGEGRLKSEYEIDVEVVEAINAIVKKETG